MSCNEFTVYYLITPADLMRMDSPSFIKSFQSHNHSTIVWQSMPIRYFKNNMSVPFLIATVKEERSGGTAD